ncbi:MAG: single-stranded-DNA-specific exonuclease RecJ [Paludibacteraceae bacterium]|jgi:single-stranded-DNA-specific exonuclease|nr:single-stranded-DNA-specific exonuclease RecJ [Paludibacteraceae bacterium]
MLRDWIVNKLTDEEELCRKTLAQQLSISGTLANLLVQRGIRTYDQAKAFFRPEVGLLHDPFLLNDMDKAVERLNRALQQDEKILVYGDYDVDGTTAVALVYKFLQNFSTNIDYYIPDRNDEGYGVSYKGIDFAAENDFKLIIVLDCGIKAIEKVAYAAQRGVDIIICDHHTPDSELPKAVAVLDPKRTDSTYPYGHLSGCGVGFKLVQAFAIQYGIGWDKLQPLLDLLAVSIASDIVPITGENRTLMHLGLKQLNASPSMGLKAIMELCELTDTKVTTSDIVFKIGPRINASGRMSSGKEAVELLIANNEETARRKGESIDQYNQLRKDLDKQATEEARKFIDATPTDEQTSSIVVYNQEWNKGVIGIVASRLSEHYYKPAVVLTLSNGFATGSARSVIGFDLYKAIDSCRDLLENFGGHTYAAGLTLRLENIAEFKERFQQYVEIHLKEEQQVPQIEIDAAIHFAEINHAFFSTLQQFAPFGPDNSKPVFVTYNVIDHQHRCRLVGQGNKHIKLDVRDITGGPSMSGIAFNAHDAENTIKYINSGMPFHICYTLEENNFNGKKSIQLMIKDIKIP